MSLKKDPIKSPTIVVSPNEENIREIHYVIEGSDKTPYQGGTYWGKLIFPKEYPLKPPSVMMLTPSGRFQPNRRLCLSMSDFHPEVSFVLVAVVPGNHDFQLAAGEDSAVLFDSIPQ